MKPFLSLVCSLLLVASSFFATGCSSVSRTPGLDVEARISPTKEGLPKRAVDVGLGLVLRNNPRFQPMAQDCIARIDVLIARGYTNPALVTEFIAEMSAKYELSQAEGAKILETLEKLRFAYWLIWGEQFPVNLALSPRAVAFLNEVKTHIANAAQIPIYFPKPVESDGAHAAPVLPWLRPALDVIPAADS